MEEYSSERYFGKILREGNQTGKIVKYQTL
jgi:hypothetical protein